jgi:hypothetical protein
MIYLYEKNMKKLRPLFENPELHKKYAAFDRPDKHWIKNRLLAYLSMWTLLPRALIGFASFALIALFSVILSIGTKLNTNEFKYGKLKRFLIHIMYNVLGRLVHLGAFFTYSISRERK